MAKLRTLFFCTECGNETPRWQGQCPACNAWNTLAEEPAPEKRRSGRGGAAQLVVTRSAEAVRLADVAASAQSVVGLDEAQPAMHRSVELVGLDAEHPGGPTIPAHAVPTDIDLPYANFAGVERPQVRHLHHDVAHHLGVAGY